MQIFRPGRMCSIRHTLLVWLVPLFLLVGVASAAFSYWSYARMVNTFMDEQMQQLAESIVQQDEPVLPMRPNPERIHEWGAYIVQIWDAQGRLEATSWEPLRAGLSLEPGFADLEASKDDWRAYATESGGPSGKRVQVLQSGEFRRKLAAERAGAAVAPVMILLPLAILILWTVAGKVSREVQDIGRAAAQQDEHTITELPLARVPGEIVPLVASFNSLLTRLRDAFAAQRRFVQDAAHELRTPITAVALQLENVRRDMPPGACAQSFAQLESGVSRAQRLVDQMLKLSRAQEAPTTEPPLTLDLQAQLRESINALIALADQRRIDLGLVAPEPLVPALVLRCGASDLRSVLDNLIENALRYTPEGGVVDVRLLREGDRAAVEVVDTGPGIPEDQLHRVFDRFFRVPGNGTRGSGLGLAIARSAAQRCGLRITLRNRTDRSGLVARIEQA